MAASGEPGAYRTEIFSSDARVRSWLLRLPPFSFVEWVVSRGLRGAQRGRMPRAR